MKARDVMTTDVVTTRPDEPITTAIRLMLGHHISGLPVVDADGNLAGMLTEGDLLRRVETGTRTRPPRWIEFLRGPGARAEDFVKSSARHVGELMTREVKCVSEDTALDRIVELMERHHIKRVPVTANGRVVGIVTRANLIRALAAAMHPAHEMAGSDLTIREKILAGLEKESWAPRASIDVAVRDGVVTYTGTIFDGRQRDALKVLAENIQGVKAVDDRLDWIEPMSGAAIAPAPRRAQ
jgi:CBS domain-containing protein